MELDAAAARRRFAAARVARLATVDAAGQPHLVPVTFALAGDVVITAVDSKPKQTLALRRLANIAANPLVSLLVDEYGEDWADLWWVRADGRARVVRAGRERDGLAALLAAKYPQYREAPPPGPAIVVQVRHWRGWAAAG